MGVWLSGSKCVLLGGREAGLGGAERKGGERQQTCVCGGSVGVCADRGGGGVSKCLQGECAPLFHIPPHFPPTLSRTGSDAWEELGCTSPLYLPTERDVGSTLRVEVTPGRYSETAPATVTAGDRPMLRGDVVSAETGERHRDASATDQDLFWCEFPILFRALSTVI